MKKKSLLHLAILFLSGTAILAQGRGRPDGEGGGAKGMQFLTTVLSLTDDQKQQASAIFDAAEQATAPLRENVKKLRESLNEAAKANASDFQIDDLAATSGNLSGQITAIRTKAFAKFYALLTPEQKTKLSQIYESGRGIKMTGNVE